MNLALATPAALLLLPLALLPLLSQVLKAQEYPSLVGIGPDPLSRLVGLALTAAGILAVAGLVLSIGGLNRRGQSIERLGKGAHIMLLIDRSASMDDTFAGRPPSGEEKSKSSAARSLLKPFIVARPHDRFGVAAFSTSPMHILPLTDHKPAVLASIDAMDRPGLAFTNVGRGLALALAMHERDTAVASRAILLVSDGAAVIDRKVQERLRAGYAKQRVNLYWLYLRTEGAKGISYVPAPDEIDTPQALPERHLDKLFRSFGVPYKAFEAESPEAIAEAIREIDRLERSPITYAERIPQKDLTGIVLAGVLGCLVVLLLAKLAEAPLRRVEGPT